MMFTSLQKNITTLNVSSISSKRITILNPLITFIQLEKDRKNPINLNFVCTHNSRRSHLSQIWAQTMASYFNIENVFCYSGGTETTAIFPKVVEVLLETGFKACVLAGDTNPIYAIKFDESLPPIIGFSKKFDHFLNPNSNFAAIMTCSHANENCPLITGAVKRIPLTYEDPKKFDGTPLQTEKYKERSLQIATELYYIFSKIK